MELEQLRQLDAIAREGTMSAAAVAVHISQPALSRSIARLEAELGQPLFDRVGRRLELNEAGQVALDHARQILRDERLMRDALDALARRTRALRVGTVAPAPLWRLTALIVERFPQTVLTSQMISEAQVEAGILDGTLDLGIALRPHTLPGVRSRQLMVENLSVSLPQQHRLADRGDLTAADLDGESFLLLGAIGFWREMCDRAFPHSEFIIQEDRDVFEQLTLSTEMAYFVTDAPSLSAPRQGRVVVPIRDAMAHATFYLLALADGRREATDVFDWVSRQ